MSGLRYEPETGKFFRGEREYTARGKNGYCYVRFEGKPKAAHRLAWFLVYGFWPPHDVDHINGVRHDNRIANLRLATRSQNVAGKRPVRDGAKGVWIHQDTRRAKRYGASVTKDGKRTFLGWYATESEAASAYIAAAKNLHGEFARGALGRA